MNLLLFFVVIGFSLALLFGVGFVPQDDPLTGELVYIGIFNLLWVLGYSIQLKQATRKRFIIALLALLAILVLYVYFMYYIVTFIEIFVE